MLLSLGLAACSANAPPAGEAPRATPEVQASAPLSATAPAPAPRPDPREAALSAAMVQLLEQEHLLRKPIDDELSRTAFATYLDRLDSSKMFLLRKDREALARFSDKIDDELRSGSLELAHEGSRIFVSRVEVVEKLVAELLSAPFDHSDEEWIELDPKKVEVATTEDELRDRWRRRLELEVLQRTAQMEARLAGDKTHDGHAKGSGAGKGGTGKGGAGKASGAGKGSGARPTKGDGQGTKGATRGSADDAEDGDDTAPMPLAKIPATPEARDVKARADLAKTYAARFTRLRHPGPFDPASELVNAASAMTTSRSPRSFPAARAGGRAGWLRAT
jgi:hypothetical protein